VIAVSTMGADASRQVFAATKAAVNRGTQAAFQALNETLQAVPAEERFAYSDEFVRKTAGLPQAVPGRRF
jgi:hypothetical protein